MSVTPSPAPPAPPTPEAPPVLLWRLYRPLDPEAAARALPGELVACEAPPRRWPLWLGPGLWGAGLGAGLVAACWGLAAVLGGGH